MAPLTDWLRGVLRKEDREMPFWEHLEELRRVLIRSIGVVLVTTLAAYVFSGRILDYLVVSSIGQATFLSPLEAFNARIKIAFLIGIVVSAPVILWQIWSFVVPGLMGRERKTVGPLVFWSALLFYAGVAFSYFYVTPTVLRLLVGLGTPHLRPMIAVSFLLDFMIGMSLASGIMFELPVVVAILSMIEIVTPDFLIRRWRHAVIVTFILTAVVTPGDVFIAQIVLGLPVLLLYFSSVFVSKAIWRGKKRKESAVTAAPGGGPS
jgi:sec-independent protein translocase protein TatC